MKAAILLRQAADVIEERRASYGDPAAFFEAVAKRWSLTLVARVTALQVILCRLDIKQQRLAHDPGHADSIIDTAGCATCGGGLLAMKITPREVEDRFEDAAQALRRLPDKRAPWHFSARPPVVGRKQRPRNMLAFLSYAISASLFAFSKFPDPSNQFPVNHNEFPDMVVLNPC